MMEIEIDRDEKSAGCRQSVSLIAALMTRVSDQSAGQRQTRATIFISSLVSCTRFFMSIYTYIFNVHVLRTLHSF